MPQTLLEKLPGDFKTLPLHVEANPDTLSYQSLGEPLNFSQMLARRRPVEITDPQRFSVRLANLGVSVRLTLEWQGRDYWLLVRQQRQDRGDVVLKLISGYVPAQELGLPLLTAVQEVAEECLIEHADGWLAGRFADIWLPTPYQAALRYRQASHFRLTSNIGAPYPIHYGALRLTERPHAYVHTPTASLQLVYDLRLELPAEYQKPSFLHVDECLEDGHLVARLNREQPDLFLMPVQQNRAEGELYTLRHGRLQPADTQDIWLAESFAPREGWLVREERIAWGDWLANGGTA